MDNNFKYNSGIKVLLLGGTGAIGNYLVHALIEQGFNVFVTTRKNRESTNHNLTYLVGNAKCLHFISDVVASSEFDVIIDFMVYRNCEFRPIVELMLKSTSHYVFLSSYRVYRDSGLDRLDESSARLADDTELKNFLGEDDYSISKSNQEDFIRDSEYRNWTIVRPTMCYSTGRLQLGSLEADFFLPRLLKGIPVAFPRELLDKSCTLTWSGDVARLILALLFKDRAKCQVFLLATQEVTHWREVVSIYNKKFANNIEIIDVKEYLKFEPDRNKLEFDRIYNRTCDNSKIMRFMDGDFQFLPVKYGVESSLENTTYNWLKTNTIDRANGRMDRVLGIWQGPEKNVIQYLKYLSGRIKLFDVIIGWYKR